MSTKTKETTTATTSSSFHLQLSPAAEQKTTETTSETTYCPQRDYELVVLSPLELTLKYRTLPWLLITHLLVLLPLFFLHQVYLNRDAPLFHHSEYVFCNLLFAPGDESCDYGGDKPSEVWDNPPKILKQSFEVTDTLRTAIQGYDALRQYATNSTGATLDRYFKTANKIDQAVVPLKLIVTELVANGASIEGQNRLFMGKEYQGHTLVKKEYMNVDSSLKTTPFDNNRTNIDLYTYENNIARINDLSITFRISQYTFSPNFFRDCIDYEASLHWSFHSRGTIMMTMNIDTVGTCDTERHDVRQLGFMW